MSHSSTRLERQAPAVPAAITDVIGSFQGLFEDRVALMLLQSSQEVSRFAPPVGVGVVTVILGGMAALWISVAITAGLATLMAPWAAVLSVGAGLAVLSCACAAVTWVLWNRTALPDAEAEHG
ncbi:MAG: phage holin family protein [Myxococcota bacterium]